MIGSVYKSTGNWYILQDEQGIFWNARIKGKLKIDDEISSTNPVAVGDSVIFEPEDEEKKIGMISGVKDRHNYMVRVSPHNKNQKHIIAANIDLALLITTITGPRTSTGFIDRFLITAEAYHIPSILVINKTDLLKERQKEVLERWTEIYTTAGYVTMPVIAREPTSLTGLKQQLKDKTTLFSGHSGVGKSTLINSLVPALNLRTSALSGWSSKGQHTTTFAEMFDLQGGGRIIDTPGVKEFGLVDIDKNELAQYFPEFRSWMSQCKFNNCKHYNEPGCAVKQAVDNGIISEERYMDYLAISDSIQDKYF